MEQSLVTNYLQYLSNGDLDGILGLFSPGAVVHSPIYGTKAAAEFYEVLMQDTNNSELEMKGIFEEKATGNIALYFDYIWTLREGEKVKFEVVDIIKLDDQGKIKELRIIYDTIQSRPAVDRLKT